MYVHIHHHQFTHGETSVKQRTRDC